MPANDSLHCGEADPCAWKLSHSVQALESPEKALGIARIKSRAIITDEISRPAITLIEAEFNSCLLVAGRVFPGVAQSNFRCATRSSRESPSTVRPSVDEESHFPARRSRLQALPRRI